MSYCDRALKYRDTVQMAGKDCWIELIAPASALHETVTNEEERGNWSHVNVRIGIPEA
jgi:hypothetical protein